jgi:hypothetical protein
VRSIQGVVPSLAVGISGQPSTALLSPRTCPYSGFSNNPQLDNLLRCLHGPVFFSFDPPGSPVGGTVTGRADRTLSPAVAGATISLVSLPLVADLVPSSHGKLVPVGRVADQVNLKMPDVPGGLYEAVVSCPRCGSSGGVDGLYPAGSILITAKAKKSVPARVISIALAIAFVIAAFLAIRTWRRRRRAMGGAGGSGGGRFSRR